VTVFGVEGWPMCGTPAEALRAHGLDGESLAERIVSALGSTGA
jgi:transketolase